MSIKGSLKLYLMYDKFLKINAKKNNFCYYEHMNIFKTFEIFLREPLSVIKERIIQIVNINSNLVTQSSVNVEMLDKKTQITVINNDKMYNLLQTVLYKQKIKAAQNSTISENKNQLMLGQLVHRK